MWLYHLVLQQASQKGTTVPREETIVDSQQVDVMMMCGDVVVMSAWTWLHTDQEISGLTLRATVAMCTQHNEAG